MQRETLADTLDEERGVARALNAVHVRWLEPTSNVTVLVAGATWGRDPSADVVLDGSKVSRHHLRVEKLGPLFVVRDLDSRNGVRVNGSRVGHHPLAPGDVLRVGDWVGIVAVAASPDELEPPHLRQLAPGVWVGRSCADVVRCAEQAATSDLHVVVEGETGTGKELFARFVHERSGRKGAFLGVNCAALGASTASSELFGHRRGAFTGATEDAPGLFRAANGGTLLLDEVAELPLPLQSLLLRALQEREVHPVGASRPVKVDLKVIAAAQRPLGPLVARGLFRADLAARLAGFVVKLPPLRHRREDVPALLRLLVRAHGGSSPSFAPALVETLLLHRWPMNVRELDTLARRFALQTRSERTIGARDLPSDFAVLADADDDPPAVGSTPPPSPTPAAAAGRAARAERAFPPEEIERLRRALEEHAGNIAKAASSLGITRSRAYRLLAAAQKGVGAKGLGG